MSLFLDQKYLSLISNRLPLFKRKSDRLYNCRCVICGDSVKNRSKARGYFFEYKTDLRYKCHNCDVSITFGTFLKKMDGNLHSQYLLEKYQEGNNVNISNLTPVITFEEPKFKTSDERLIDSILTRLDTLPEDHEVVLFCKKRKISETKFKQLYFIDNVKDIVQLNNDYKESIKGEEPRLVLPFYTDNGELSGVTCRALRGEALRYITVKIKDNVPLIFGLNEVDKSKKVYVVEGPIDSLFVKNAIAVAGTALNKVKLSGIPSDQLVYIYDNQPRNKELCNLISRSIDQGCNVVIWPQNLIEKDINDMVLSGKDVMNIIKNNTFEGLTAKAKFISWKRV